MTRATVVTDASFCPATHLAAWAAVAYACEWRRPRGRWDLIPGRLSDNNAAEISAAAEGIALAGALGATSVILVTDSEVVLRAATGLDEERALVFARALRVRIAGGPPPVTVRQVPGHGAGLSLDERAIGWCDRQARRAMRNCRGRIPMEGRAA